jgi:hypothetical protein
MTAERRLVDPIHFFNTTGLAAVTEKFLLDSIDELLKDNAKLSKLVRKAKQAGFIEEIDPA